MGKETPDGPKDQHFSLITIVLKNNEQRICKNYPIILSLPAIRHRVDCPPGQTCATTPLSRPALRPKRPHAPPAKEMGSPKATRTQSSAVPLLPNKTAPNKSRRGQKAQAHALPSWAGILAKHLAQISKFVREPTRHTPAWSQVAGRHSAFPPNSKTGSSPPKTTDKDLPSQQGCTEGPHRPNYQAPPFTTNQAIKPWATNHNKAARKQPGHEPIDKVNLRRDITRNTPTSKPGLRESKGSPCKKWVRSSASAWAEG